MTQHDMKQKAKEVASRLMTDLKAGNDVPLRRGDDDMTNKGIRE